MTHLRDLYTAFDEKKLPRGCEGDAIAAKVDGEIRDRVGKQVVEVLDAVVERMLPAVEGARYALQPLFHAPANGKHAPDLAVVLLALAYGSHRPGGLDRLGYELHRAIEKEVSKRRRVWLRKVASLGVTELRGLSDADDGGGPAPGEFEVVRP